MEINNEELQIGQKVKVVVDAIVVQAIMGDNQDGTLWLNHVLKAEEGRAEIENEL